MKIVIVEDEINAAEYLQTLLGKVRPQAEILTCLESVEDAINWVYQHEAPDLIFMDIQLSDGLSFEIFKHVKITAPIIFTTAFDQYAIDAFKVNSIDYLLKPIAQEELQQALDKYDTHQANASSPLAPQFQELLKQFTRQKKNRCLVKKGQHFEFIEVGEIAWVQSEDGLTFLHTFKGRRHIYNHTVERLMDMLDETAFFQINRGEIVNIQAIQKVHPYFNQRMKVELSLVVPNSELIVSRAKVPQFKEWLDG